MNQMLMNYSRDPLNSHKKWLLSQTFRNAWIKKCQYVILILFQVLSPSHEDLFPRGWFWYDSRDEKLLSLHDDSQDIPQISIPTDVDDEANNIIQILQTARADSCNRKKGRNLATA